MPRAFLVALVALSCHQALGLNTDYAGTKAQAERLYAEKSFQKAHDAYAALEKLDVPAAERRWVQFRLADTLWRSQAGAAQADPTRLDQALQALQAMVEKAPRPEDRDRVWAEVQESLGDFYWLRPDLRSASGFTFYQQALEYWAGAPDVELARARYLAIVRRAALPEWREPGTFYGQYGTLPLPIVESFLRIARTDADKVFGHYLLAMTLRRSGGDWEQRARIPEEFEAALRGGKGQDWYDATLYEYAQHLETEGRLTAVEDGSWRQTPDYPAALALYQRLVREHRKGESRFYDPARARIDEISKPVLSLSAAGLFVPDTAPQLSTSWRNVKAIELALYRVDLVRDVRMPRKEGDEREEDDLVHRVDLSGAQLVKRWTRQTGDTGKYTPGSESIAWPDRLPAGAYLVEASAAGVKKVRDLVLVTDAVVTVKAMGAQAVVWLTSAVTGAPIPGAQVLLWQRHYEQEHYVWRSYTGTTGADGLATFRLEVKDESSFVATARLGQRQAYCTGEVGTVPGRSSSWRIHAFTDRPAYRPREKVQWKFVARTHDGSVYDTPRGQELSWEITDPRGAKAFEGKATLDAFGAAWGALELGETLPLGEYHIAFRHGDNQVSNAVLFRLEEYKLPEFTVKVSTPRDEAGRPRLFRLGEEVEAEIRVEHYSGGPVADAEVVVLVHQRPSWRSWRPARAYDWYYDDLYPDPYAGYGDGSVVKQETLKTDAGGAARIRFETPRGAGQDFEYRVEARVTDSSRREVVSSESVRVARQRFEVHATPRHLLLRPRDKATVDIQALDANDQPVAASGKVTITREWWSEVWVDAAGKELTRAELTRLRARNTPGLRLKFQGYHHDLVDTRQVKTDAQGKLELSFVTERDGFYRVAWTTEEQGRNPITAETTLWVATDASADLGYRHDGVQIIVDQDTFAVGTDAPVMLATDAPDRWVLFAVEGEDLYEFRVVHVKGTVKLLHLAVQPRHVPNVFLDALMVSDRQVHRDTRQIIVPPVDHFLDLTVRADKDVYQPREEATLSVVARDRGGKPVSAQVALALVDESVFYVQQPYAGDPRQFFFGQKRSQQVPTATLLDSRAFYVPEPTPDADDLESTHGSGVGHGYGYGVGGLAARAAPSAPASVAEMEEKSASPKAAAKQPVTYDAKAGAVGKKDRKAPDAGGEESGGDQVLVRSDFRATATFMAAVVTDAQGRAQVKTTMPDSLTAWRATARAASTGSQFGAAEATVRTRQPLIVRLQAPRFFLVGDRVTVSAVVENNSPQPLSVAPALVAEGLSIEGALVDGKVAGKQAARTVPASGAVRFDWQVQVEAAGPVKLKAVARAGALADAMELPFTAWPHGLEKALARGGKLAGDEAQVSLDLPVRKAGSTRMTVQVAPSQAVTMLDALPYLVQYPYGCTEQTMSRFLPAVIVARTLKDQGLDPEEAMGRVFGGIEPSTAGATHPQGKHGLQELSAVTAAGLARLHDFQHGDGGWGWWKTGDSDRFMTAYVLWGLTLAASSGVAVDEDAAARAASFLDVNLVNEELAPDRQAWMLHALSAHQARTAGGQPTPYQQKAFENLWKGRERLNAYSRALLTLSAVAYHRSAEAKILVGNLENGVVLDRAEDASVLLRNEPSGLAVGTAHWGRDSGWWMWSEGAVETTAFVLRALLAVDPRHRLVQPAANWLVKNRRGGQWSNTRDTAIAVLALNDFLRATGEVAQDVEYSVQVNGKEIATRRIPRAQLLSAPSVFDVDPGLLRDGKNEIRISRKRGAALYFFVQATFTSLEEPVKAAGNEVFARRRYFKWVGRPTLLNGVVYERQPLGDGETVQSGDRVEVVLTLETKNDYEYLLFEDLKPAGFEAVEVRSGQPLFARELRASAHDRALADRALEEGLDTTGRTHPVHQELRDRKVALFVDRLEQGVWELRYDLRAEVPGQFHALPVLGQAMYVPEIRCNGEESHVRVVDRPAP